MEVTRHSGSLTPSIGAFIRLNPIFTEGMGSSFVLDTTEEDLDQGLVFKIKDWDRVGSNDVLGQVTVSKQQLLEPTGEPIELEISPPSDRKDEKGGFITLKHRFATEADRKPKKTILNRLGLNGSKYREDASCWSYTLFS